MSRHLRAETNDEQAGLITASKSSKYFIALPLISDALPLLKAATEVTIVEIASEEGMAAAREHLGDVVGWLKRHGIESTPMVAPSSRDDATELYAIARDNVQTSSSPAL